MEAYTEHTLSIDGKLIIGSTALTLTDSYGDRCKIGIEGPLNVRRGELMPERKIPSGSYNRLPTMCKRVED